MIEFTDKKEKKPNNMTEKEKKNPTKQPNLINLKTTHKNM